MPPPPPLGRAAEAGCVRAMSVHAGVRCCAVVCYVGSWVQPGSGQTSRLLAGGRGARCAMVVFALQDIF